MNSYTFTVYTAIYILSLLISLLVFWRSWRKKHIRTSFYLSLMMLGLTAWTLAGVFEVSAITEHLKIFWSKMEYLGGTATPLLLFLFTIEYCKNEKWINTRNIFLLSLIPAIVFLLALTNEYHGLIWSGFHPGPEGSNLLIYEHGKAFKFLYVPYSYLLLLTSTLLLIRNTGNRPNSLRLQSTTVLLAVLLTWAANFLYITNLNPLPGLELTRVSFSLSGLILYFAIIRLKLLELSPIARSTLIDNMKDGVIVLDDYKRIIDINDSAIDMLIGKGQKIIGNTIENINFKYTEVKQFLLSPNDESAEICITDPFYCFEISKSSLRGYKQNLYGWLISIHDITKRKQLENSVAHSTQQLKEANADKDKFFTMLSHDLRSPLGSLRNLAEALYYDSDNLPQARRNALISSIFSASDQTYMMVEDLLEWSKQNTGRMGVFVESVSINDVIDEVLPLYQNHLNLKNISFTNAVTKDTQVFCDRHMLLIIMRNLLSNSIKYTYSGGKISLSSTIIPIGNQGSPLVEIYIKDTGVGMSAEKMERLFQDELNSSTSGTMEEKGSGVGLIICKDLIKKNGGTIKVSSLEGGGTTFCITLPAAVNTI